MTAPVRLSVTMLDTFVSGMDNQDMSALQLAERLFMPLVDVPLAMRAGTALHACLEHATDADDLALSLTEGWDKFVFLLPDDLEGTVELGHTREHKSVMPLPELDAQLVGKYDALTGSHVIDHKLTGRFDHERYIDSLQWRAYLMMTGKPRFAYQVFEHGGIPEPDEHDNRVITIKKYHRMEMCAYPGMADDVMDVVSELVSFAKVWMPIVRGVAKTA